MIFEVLPKFNQLPRYGFWNWKFRILTLTVSLALTCSCSEQIGFDTSQMLTVEMKGVFSAPEWATGNSTPRGVNLALTSVSLIQADGSPLTFEIEEAAYSAIVNRAQKLAEFDLADYDGASFIGASIAFEPLIEVIGKYNIGQMELESGTRSASSAFTITPARKVTLDVRINWRNTITVDEVEGVEDFQEPEIVMTVN